MAEAGVVAGAQQREREPEVAFQRRKPFDERALAPHLGEVAAAVDAPETGDLRAEALGIGVTPLRLDGVLLLMVQWTSGNVGANSGRKPCALHFATPRG